MSVLSKATDAASTEVVQRIRHLELRYRVRSLGPLEAVEAGLLLHELHAMMPAPDLSQDPVAAAMAEAAKGTPEEQEERALRRLRDGFDLAARVVDGVYDAEEKRWRPCKLVPDGEECEDSEKTHLPISLLDGVTVLAIVAASLRPAREVAGVLRPFSGGGAGGPGDPGSALRPVREAPERVAGDPPGDVGRKNRRSGGVPRRRKGAG